MAKRAERKKQAPAPELKTILLVDDQDDCRIATKWFLNFFGYSVDSACNAEEALVLFDPKVHDVVITDNRMPGMTGSEMAHIVKLRSPSTPVVMYTGLPPQDQTCLDAVLQRPAQLLTLKAALDKLLASKEVGKSNSSSSPPEYPQPK